MLVVEYFTDHPKEETSYDPVIDYVNENYLGIIKGSTIERIVRKLEQEGFLIKVRKGIYKHDPDYIEIKETYDFPESIKQEIFKRDDYKCVVCGRGAPDGQEITADHIIAKDKGGENTLENGQTLCSPHNLLKKNYSQTEFAKKIFSNLYREAKKLNDSKMVKFCEEILATFQRYGIDSHQ